MTLLDYLYGRPLAMPDASAKAAVKESHTHPVQLAEGKYMVVLRRGDPAAMRAACDRMIERMKADKRKGDAVAFLREFRDNPRA